MSHLAQILLVEDNFIDVEQFKRKFSSRRIDADLICSTNGKEALESLKELVAKSSSEQMKQLVILDINMPIMDGHEFLDALRNNEQLSSCVVIVFTSSEHLEDVKRAFEKHVSGYFLKDNMEDLLDVIESYFKASEFPNLSS